VFLSTLYAFRLIYTMPFSLCSRDRVAKFATRGRERQHSHSARATTKAPQPSLPYASALPTYYLTNMSALRTLRQLTTISRAVRPVARVTPRVTLARAPAVSRILPAARAFSATARARGDGACMSRVFMGAEGRDADQPQRTSLCRTSSRRRSSTRRRPRRRRLTLSF
jgi:hypothetical protein